MSRLATIRTSPCHRPSLDQPWHRVEFGCMRLHERSSSVERWDSKVTVLILSLFLLDVKSDAGTPVQEICNPLEVLRGATARGHRRGPDADATGRKRRGVARDRVAIQRDGRSLTHLLNIGPRQSVWTKIPEHQVIGSSPLASLCPLAIKAFAKVSYWTQRPWSIPQIQVCSPPATAQPRLRYGGYEAHPAGLDRQP